MDNAMNGSNKFDWPGFIVRQFPVLALAIWWLVKTHRNELVFVGCVSAILTALNYLQARRV